MYRFCMTSEGITPGHAARSNPFISSGCFDIFDGVTSSCMGAALSPTNLGKGSDNVENLRTQSNFWAGIDIVEYDFLLYSSHAGTKGPLPADIVVDILPSSEVHDVVLRGLTSSVSSGDAVPYVSGSSKIVPKGVMVVSNDRIV